MQRHADNVALAMCGTRGGEGVWTALENHKSYRVRSDTGPDPLEMHKFTKPTFNVGSSLARQQNAIYMAFRWRADDDPLLVIFGYSLS